MHRLITLILVPPPALSGTNKHSATSCVFRAPQSLLITHIPFSPVHSSVQKCRGLCSGSPAQAKNDSALHPLLAASASIRCDGPRILADAAGGWKWPVSVRRRKLAPSPSPVPLRDDLLNFSDPLHLQTAEPTARETLACCLPQQCQRLPEEPHQGSKKASFPIFGAQISLLDRACTGVDFRKNQVPCTQQTPSVPSVPKMQSFICLPLLM
mmetsp:Transcript_18813/g.54411  ORF Transcript_18813/g.54411 Transcript_18813/m.54411 type:complete len:211 (+) Transcript_18813:729-1361(+)